MGIIWRLMGGIGWEEDGEFFEYFWGAEKGRRARRRESEKKEGRKGC